MKLHLWILLIGLNILLADVAFGAGSSINTETLILGAGYPYEEHQCETSDGYILALHRIPYSARVNTSTPRPVAFLMHGLLSSSSDWLLLNPDSALPYVLSDAGYDVWLGNARGNRYSRKHVTRSPESKRFWNFSWHEIGIIDLPDMIDYIRFYTGVDQVRYFGHSQGTTVFFVLTSLNLEFKDKIKSAHLLAPAAFIDHVKSPVLRIPAPIFGRPNPLVEIFGSFEFLPNTKFQEVIANKVCPDGAPTQILCSALIYFFAGYDPDNLNTTLLPQIFSIYPSGISFNQLIHYLQEANSGYFRQFDYGPTRNILTYGRRAPPSYPLEKIDVPTFFYYGENDIVITVEDVQRTINVVSNSTLRRAYLVPHPKWNHLDFMWATNARELVYDVVMEDVASVP